MSGVWRQGRDLCKSDRKKDHAVMQFWKTGNFWRHPVTILHELGIGQTNLLDVVLSILDRQEQGVRVPNLRQTFRLYTRPTVQLPHLSTWQSR